MATRTASKEEAETIVGQRRAGFLSGRRGRALRETLTAYAFLLPALLILFTFGVFPIFYAGYVSLYKWRIRQNEFVGLDNFVRAMGDVAYLFFAALVLVLVIVGITYAIRGYRTARANNIPLTFPLLALVPGALISYGMAQILLRFITFFAQEQAIEAGEARILGNVLVGLAFIVAGGALGFGLNRWQHRAAASNPHAVLPSFLGTAVIVTATLVGAFLLAEFTYSELQASDRYGVAVIRVALMAAGVVLIGVAYLLWRWAFNQQSTLKAIGGVLTAIALVATAGFFIIFWPIISRESDPDFYLSLKVTVFYSVGTVPIQLAIAILLAYLLYQPIKGKGLFRVIFFVPYIAPAVATAGIFQVLFSPRTTSIANRAVSLLTFGNVEAFKWLKEPNSAISVFAQAFGVDVASGWEFGPSLALIVIILFNIWVFVGYNTVIFLAGLGNIPGVLYEAAEIDGAGRWALFRHVTLPLLSPVTFFLSVLAVIGTFKAFNHVWVLRDPAALGTVDTASIYFFETFFRGSRFGYATSMAIVLFVIILALTLVQNRLAERRVFYG